MSTPNRPNPFLGCIRCNGVPTLPDLRKWSVQDDPSQFEPLAEIIGRYFAHLDRQDPDRRDD